MDTVDLCSAWQAVDLPNLQLVMDEQAAKVATLREGSLTARKALAAQTRAYRAASTSVDPSALLKAYQAEIDALTDRSRFGENAFLTMYKLLREAPDPCATLEYASHALSQGAAQLSAAQSANEKLEARLKRQAAELRNARTVADRVQELEGQQQEWWNELEQRHEGKLQGMKSDYEAKLLEAFGKAEEAEAALQLQLELAATEAARVTESAEREAAARPGNSAERIRTDHSAATSALQTDAAEAAEERSAVLSAQVDALQRRSQAEAASHAFQLEQARRGTAALKAELTEAQRNLAERPSREAFDQLRKQLHWTQRIAKSDGAALDIDSSDLDANVPLDSLEQWLVKTNEELRRRAVERDSEVAKLRGELETSRKREHEVTAPSVLVTPTETPVERGGGDGMLKALCLQRDRLKEQLQRRERKIDELQQRVDSMEHSSHRLRTENTTLLQRVRFLQSYKVSERSTLLANAPNDALFDEEHGGFGGAKGGLGLGRGVDHSFRGIWASNSPIMGFGAERTADILGTLESVVLKVLSAFLSRRRGRLFLFFYLGMLHIFPFFLFVT